jgi:starch synthase
MPQTSNIVFLGSEMVPYCKTGGLADVIGALPVELARLGNNVTVIVPFYRKVLEWSEKTGIEIHPVEDSTLSFFLPGYTGQAYLREHIHESGMRVLFIDYPPAYDREELYTEGGTDYEDNATRFGIFAKAGLEACKKLGIKPDILHAHDWQAACTVIFLKTHYRNDEFFAGTKSVLTIHNLGYQGRFPADKFPALDLPWTLFSVEGLEYFGQVNVLKGGIQFADRITTVSPTYSQEIQTPEFGAGLDGVLRTKADKLSGILNGVDYSAWDPSIDKMIPKNFSPDSLGGKWACRKALRNEVGLPEGKGPLIGMISRLAEQKGFELLLEALDRIVKLDCQIVILGTGDPRYHQQLTDASAKYPKNVYVKLGFSNELAHKIEAGSDIFLMPSRYEPCGLNQMYSLRYGTVPIVSSTGGLKDTVDNVSPARLQSGKATGFVMKDFSSNSLFNTVKKAAKMFRDEPSAWQKLMVSGMKKDFSWLSQAKIYMKLYDSLIKERNVSVEEITA